MNSKWTLTKSDVNLNDDQKNILEDFPFDEIAELEDDQKMIDAVKRIIGDDRDLIRKIFDIYIEMGALDAIAVFADNAYDSLDGGNVLSFKF